MFTWCPEWKLVACSFQVDPEDSPKDLQVLQDNPPSSCTVYVRCVFNMNTHLMPLVPPILRYTPTCNTPPSAVRQLLISATTQLPVTIINRRCGFPPDACLWGSQHSSEDHSLVWITVWFGSHDLSSNYSPPLSLWFSCAGTVLVYFPLVSYCEYLFQSLFHFITHWVNSQRISAVVEFYQSTTVVVLLPPGISTYT